MNEVPFDRSRLSTREDEILTFAIEGLTDIQIAQKMDITQSTVNSYWVRIRGKLGQFSRTELVALALKEKARQEMAAMNEVVGRLQAEARSQIRIDHDYANAEIFRAALEAMPEATLISCDKGIIRFVNPRFEAMFGYESGELLNQPVEVLVPGSVRQRERELIHQYLEDPKPLRIGFVNVIYGRRRNGTDFRIALLLDSQPTSVGRVISCIARDFSTEIDQRRQFVSSWQEAGATIG